MSAKTFQETDAELSDVLETRKVAWEAMHAKAPKYLYHYTSAQGLYGILHNKKMWATDVNFLNDSTELLYTHGLIRKALGDALRKRRTPFVKNFLARVIGGEFREGPTSIVYATCFCEKQDVLSQWRGYGAMGGGYALGFLPQSIRQKSPTDDSPGFVLRRVEYREKNQRRWIAETVRAVCDVLEGVPADLPEEQKSALLLRASDTLSQSLSQAVFCFKHPGFREEGEWRIVHESRFFVRSEYLNFRLSTGKIVPYVEFDLTEDSGGGTRLLPLREIRYGPTLNKQATENSLRQLLEQFGYRGVEITQSEVPLTA